MAGARIAWTVGNVRLPRRLRHYGSNLTLGTHPEILLLGTAGWDPGWASRGVG